MNPVAGKSTDPFDAFASAGIESLRIDRSAVVDCLVSALYSKASGRTIIWETMQRGSASELECVDFNENSRNKSWRKEFGVTVGYISKVEKERLQFGRKG